ncbi:undecaprenyl-phosphate glucose phosphotransferase [Thiomicrospira sp. XS5]|uniref:undecaprenyl-phosphate glucose phosphotransferase n=1 Tax=Thiomicrospira sp. XS5 TaxID=1775636 RepID=UPI000839A200|nr:undecaprenyl-phosphate glucose phosphotransferase [Thiomicrospira sp. XS5]
MRKVDGWTFDIKAILHPDRASFVWLHRSLDFIVTAGLFVGIFFQETSLHGLALVAFGLVAGLTFVVVSQLLGIYQHWRGRPFFASIKLVLEAWLWTWLLWLALVFLFSSWTFWPKQSAVLWGLSTPVALIAYRLMIRKALIFYRAQGGNSKNIVIVGHNALAKSLAETILCNAGLGYRLLWFYDLVGSEQTFRLSGGDCVDLKPLRSDALKLEVEEHDINEVYICLPVEQVGDVKHVLETLSDIPVVIKFVPDMFVFDLLHAKVTDIDGIPVIGVFDSALTGEFERFIKRVEDVVIASAALLVFSPLMLVLALGVKWTSPGPVLFKQKRYGLSGREIRVYKFRTMFDESTESDGQSVAQTRKDDKRVTPLGRLLRRTSLDELPQFINVLQGKMSVVGPRPHAVAHNEMYRKLVPKYMQRYLVKPGITGWAQVNGWRGETDSVEKMCKRVEFDLHYIRNWSFWFDMKIIAMTFYKGFMHKNAY